MTGEERITQLEQRADKLESNDKGFAEAIKALMQASLHHSEMMEDFFRGMNELRAAQENTDVKLAALVDAQIRAEDEMKAIREEAKAIREETKAIREETKAMREETNVMREGINQLRDGMDQLREDMSELRGITKELVSTAIKTNKRLDDLEGRASE